MNSRISHELILKTEKPEEFKQILEKEGQDGLPPCIFDKSIEIYEPPLKERKISEPFIGETGHQRQKISKGQKIDELEDWTSIVKQRVNSIKLTPKDQQKSLKVDKLPSRAKVGESGMDDNGSSSSLNQNDLPIDHNEIDMDFEENIIDSKSRDKI